MKYTMNFGRLPTSAASRSDDESFRIAVLGDFSGRANEGKLETGRELAARRPLRVDVDNTDAIISRLGLCLHLPISADGGTVEVKIECMDDFHPDELFDKLGIFSELKGLRRRLSDTSTFAAAAAEVHSWGQLNQAEKTAKPRTKPRGTAIPNAKRSDFARLIGQTTALSPAATPIDDLIKQVIAPYVVPVADPEQDILIAAVDEALAGVMRSVLHHPDFQALESLWRSVDLLTRQLETDTQLTIDLFDVTAEEIAADLSASDALEETGLYKLLVEQPPLDQQRGSLSVLLGNYIFEQTPPHAELLGRVAKIAAAAQAPFITGASTEFLKDRKPDQVHPIISESWTKLREIPEAAYLGLALPRFMLRWPYGAKTDPVAPFDFEEFTPQSGLRGMLWGNGAILAGLLLGQTYTQQSLRGMRLGSIMSLLDVPFYYYTNAEGDQVALPCTERLVSERAVAQAVSQHLMPLVSIRGRTEVRLGSFVSLAGKELLGPWSSASDMSAVVSASELDEETTSETVEEAETEDESEDESELDAVLADIDAEEEHEPSGEYEMDPELADLLDDL